MVQVWLAYRALPEASFTRTLAECNADMDVVRIDIFGGGGTHYTLDLKLSRRVYIELTEGSSLLPPFSIYPPDSCRALVL